MYTCFALESGVSLPWSVRSAYLLHLGAHGQLTCFTLERKVSLPACPAWPWSARSAYLLHLGAQGQLTCMPCLALERKVSLPASPWSARSAYLLHLGARGQLTCFTLERKVSLPASPWSARSAYLLALLGLGARGQLTCFTLERKASLPASPWSARSAYLLALLGLGARGQLTCFTLERKASLPASPWSARSAYLLALLGLGARGQLHGVVVLLHQQTSQHVQLLQAEGASLAHLLLLRHLHANSQSSSRLVWGVCVCGGGGVWGCGQHLYSLQGCGGVWAGMTVTVCVYVAVCAYVCLCVCVCVCVCVCAHACWSMHVHQCQCVCVCVCVCAWLCLVWETDRQNSHTRQTDRQTGRKRETQTPCIYSWSRNQQRKKAATDYKPKSLTLKRSLAASMKLPALRYSSMADSTFFFSSRWEAYLARRRSISRTLCDLASSMPLSHWLRLTHVSMAVFTRLHWTTDRWSVTPYTQASVKALICDQAPWHGNAGDDV